MQFSHLSQKCTHLKSIMRNVSMHIISKKLLSLVSHWIPTHWAQIRLNRVENMLQFYSTKPGSSIIAAWCRAPKAANRSSDPEKSHDLILMLPSFRDWAHQTAGEPYKWERNIYLWGWNATSLVLEIGVSRYLNFYLKLKCTGQCCQWMLRNTYAAKVHTFVMGTTF